MSVSHREVDVAVHLLALVPGDRCGLDPWAVCGLWFRMAAVHLICLPPIRKGATTWRSASGALDKEVYRKVRLPFPMINIAFGSPPGWPDLEFGWPGGGFNAHSWDDVEWVSLVPSWVVLCPMDCMQWFSSVRYSPSALDKEGFL